MNVPSCPSDPAPNDPAVEVESLARELARSYAALVDSHRKARGVGAVEADAKAREHSEWAVEAAHRDPVDHISWWQLATAMERDPETVRQTWERIKAEARAELRSGHRSAIALEWGGRPWDRARFLAIRDGFAEGWHPRGGIETALIDTLAQSFTAYLQWTERATTAAEAESEHQDYQLKEHGKWQAPRMATAEWMDWCADQAERAHRRFLMTLKAMQELRRLPAVLVTGVGQVNVGAQQVNIAAPAPRKTRSRTRADLPKSSGYPRR